jgi:hypothetical protein
MPAREISRDEWAEFCDSFSRQHEGWISTIEVFGPDIGAQVEARGISFAGITAELKTGGEDVITITTREQPEGHVTHVITSPKKVMLEETEEGAHEALKVEAADGAATLLRFRSAVLPEMVDGVVSE